MQTFLSHLVKTDINDSISIIAYISQIRSDLLLRPEFETLCLELYNCLKILELTGIVDTILTLLEDVKNHNFFTLSNFKIFVSDKLFFRFVILASLKHCKEIFSKKDLTISAHHKRQILQEAMLTFRADKTESIFMLQLIENLIKKNRYMIDSDLAFQLLFFCQKAVISPLEGFRTYVHSISKTALHSLDSKDLGRFLDLELLPIKGIETLELVPYFKHACKDERVISNIVTKVIKMFDNNIENREGGFLYRSVLFDDFSYWKVTVWPQFLVKFQMIDFNSEFFQSLLKYWIPLCVSVYKLEFYSFISTTPISNYLKGYILLETRKKGLIDEYDEEMLRLISSLFADNDTSSLALQIVSSYVKRTLYPLNVELQLVKSYLCGRREALDSEELKCLHRFLSQIGVVGSELWNLKVCCLSSIQEQQLAQYDKFVTNLYTFSLKLLQTSNKDAGAQILALFWKLTHYVNPYLLNYKLNRYCSEFYFKFLQHRQAQAFEVLIEKALIESNGQFPELIKLAQLMAHFRKFYSDDYLLKFIDECTELNSIMAAESIKNISKVIVSQHILGNIVLLLNLMEAAITHFKNFSPGLKDVFKAVLLFEAIVEFSKYWHCQEAILFGGFHIYCLPVIADILQNNDQIYEQEIKKDNFDTVDQQYDLACKSKKMVEALFNNVLRFIIQDGKIIWDLVDKTKIMDLLVQIIETSNMRRPTTLSADAIKHIAKLIDVEYEKDRDYVHPEITERNNEAASYKIKLLHNTLQKLLGAASVQNLTIRRNPESRLIIHALCQAENHLQKPALNQTLHYLLGILSDPDSSDSTVSSAMHCTEILISDNSMYNHTIRFVPDVILQCVEHFKNRNWIVRNANLQLARSLIDRFLGVVTGPNNRSKSVEDLFSLFPQVAPTFYRTLIQQPLTDSALIVMQIFSESQIRRQPLDSEFSAITRDVFLRVFVTLIKDNRDHYGLFALRAYTSLCPEEEIPNIIAHIVDFIVGNFAYIQVQHTLRNFVLLLSELSDKFLGYVGDFPVKPRGYFTMHESLSKLSISLRQSNNEQFDLLSFKVLSVDEVMTVIRTSNFDIYDYRQRVWLHNYIPFVFINAEAAVLDKLLREILFKNISDCVQVKILSILVDRHSKNHFSDNNLVKISNVLVQKVLITDDSRNYLLLCYFKVIFLFFKPDKTRNIEEYRIKDLRSAYGKVRNVYKLCVFILQLSQVSCSNISKNDCDKKFIKTAIKHFQNLSLKNFEMALIISDMLPYLYANAGCVCDKYQILLIAVLLVVEHGLFDFVRFVTRSKISSPLIAMITVLNFEFLTKYFGSCEVACQFVKEFYKIVPIKYTDGSRNISKTYYVEEKDIYVEKLFIDKIVIKFVRAAQLAVWLSKKPTAIAFVSQN